MATTASTEQITVNQLKQLLQQAAAKAEEPDLLIRPEDFNYQEHCDHVPVLNEWRLNEFFDYFDSSIIYSLSDPTYSSIFGAEQDIESSMRFGLEALDRTLSGSEERWKALNLLLNYAFGTQRLPELQTI
jgi:hypothetical protein